MALNFFADEDAQEGTEVVYKMRDDDNELHDVVMIVRKTPPGKNDELSIRHYGKKLATEGVDKPKVLAFHVDKASYALMAVKSGFPPIRLKEPTGAALFTAALERQVAVGDVVDLNGIEWSRRLKELVFRSLRDFMYFVVTASDKLGDTDAQTERDLGKT